MNSAQRKHLQTLTSAFQTTYTVALEVVTATPLMHLQIKTCIAILTKEEQPVQDNEYDRI